MFFLKGIKILNSNSILILLNIIFYILNMIEFKNLFSYKITREKEVMKDYITTKKLTSELITFSLN